METKSAAYYEGFIAKCAEHNVDPEKLIKHSFSLAELGVVAPALGTLGALNPTNNDDSDASLGTRALGAATTAGGAAAGGLGGLILGNLLASLIDKRYPKLSPLADATAVLGLGGGGVAGFNAGQHVTGELTR